MVEITSKCKTTKTTPRALDPKEDLVTTCKSKTHPSIRVCLQHLHAKLFSNQYFNTDSSACRDNHELTSDRVHWRNVHIQNYLLTSIPAVSSVLVATVMNWHVDKWALEACTFKVILWSTLTMVSALIAAIVKWQVDEPVNTRRNHSALTLRRCILATRTWS